MRERPSRKDDTLWLWLAAESRQDEDLSETLLTRLFQTVPHRAPAPGFAARVVTAVASRRRFGVALWIESFSRSHRLGIAVAMAVVGLVVGFMLPVWGVVLPHVSIGSLIAIPTQSLAHLVDHLATYAPAWRVLSNLWQALFVVGTAPQVILFGVASVVLSAVVWRTLLGPTLSTRSLHA